MQTSLPTWHTAIQIINLTRSCFNAEITWNYSKHGLQYYLKVSHGSMGKSGSHHWAEILATWEMSPVPSTSTWLPERMLDLFDLMNFRSLIQCLQSYSISSWCDVPNFRIWMFKHIQPRLHDFPCSWPRTELCPTWSAGNAPSPGSQAA